MKVNRIILVLTILIVSGMNKAVAQFDYDIYPPDSLKGKGILVSKHIKREAMYDEQWWLSEGAFSLNAEMVEYSEKFVVHFDREHPDGYSEATREYELDIPAGPFRVCGQDDEYYHISSRHPKYRAMMVRQFPAPAYLRIKKCEMDSLGFRFISCEQLVAFYKSSRPTNDPVGANMLPPLQVVSPEPHKMGEAFSGPFPYYLFFILKSVPSSAAPFISIVEPRTQGQESSGVYRYEMLSKNGYWYELQVQFSFMFGGVNWDAVYQGDTYTGYWQAPFDEAGFPYILVDIVQDRTWPETICRLIHEQ